MSSQILDKTLGQQTHEPDPQRPTTVAEQVQDAIDRGASLDQIRRHFHLSKSELRDYCADIMDDEFDDPDRSSVSGCGDGRATTNEEWQMVTFDNSAAMAALDELDDLLSDAKPAPAAAAPYSAVPESLAREGG